MKKNDPAPLARQSRVQQLRRQQTARIGNDKETGLEFAALALVNGEGISKGLIAFVAELRRPIPVLDARLGRKLDVFGYRVPTRFNLYGIGSSGITVAWPTGRNRSPPPMHGFTNKPRK